LLAQKLLASLRSSLGSIAGLYLNLNLNLFFGSNLNLNLSLYLDLNLSLFLPRRLAPRRPLPLDSLHSIVC